jgi:hypothetical protein
MGTRERISDGVLYEYNTQFHDKLVDEPINIPTAEEV